jgi:predicted extracellular nuclease
MNRFFSGVILLCFSITILSFTNNQSKQKKQPQTQVCVAFYNCENFFDTINQPNVKDEEFLPEAKTQWNTSRYNTKKNHIAQVISSMNGGKGADIIGLSEIENKGVLQDLINEPSLKKSDYGIVHYDSPDERGIDVAFLYKKNVLQIINSKAFPIHLSSDSTFKTRDILLVKGQFKNGKQVYFFVNHFPSRRNGAEASEFKRIFCAEVEKKIIDSISKADAANNPTFISLGDFNDTPTNNSMQTLINADKNGLENLFAKFPDTKEGSIYYNGNWDMFDQILVSKKLEDCNASTVCYVKNSATIFKPEFVLEQTPGKYFGAPFKTFAGTRYFGGYSDHMSVYILLNVN